MDLIQKFANDIVFCAKANGDSLSEAHSFVGLVASLVARDVGDLIGGVNKAAIEWEQFDRDEYAAFEANLTGAVRKMHPTMTREEAYVQLLDEPGGRVLATLAEYAGEPPATNVAKRTWAECSAAERAERVLEAGAQAIQKADSKMSYERAFTKFLETDTGRALYQIHVDTDADRPVSEHLAKLYREDRLMEWAAVKKYLAGDMQ